MSAWRPRCATLARMRFIIFSLVLAACYVAPVPVTVGHAPVVAATGGPVVVTGGWWSCREGNCRYSCPPSSTCSADCAGGGCALACAGGSTCNFDCAGGNCATDCAPGSVCNLESTG